MPKITPERARDNLVVDSAQKFLSELMVNFPNGRSNETDEALQAAVATYLELRAIEQGRKFHHELKVFSEGVQSFYDEA